MYTLQHLYDKYPELEAACGEAISSAYTAIRSCYERGGKLLVCGNGGSAADSEHIVGELMKGFMKLRPIPEDFRQRLTEADPECGDYIARHLQGALPAISLVGHSALATAYANDAAPELVFAQQVFGYGKKGDVLLALSTSGNSTNVLHALKVARTLGLHTIGMTGRTGGRMRPWCDTAICVPYDSTPDIQERHLPIYHALCMLVEEAFFPS